MRFVEIMDSDSRMRHVHRDLGLVLLSSVLLFLLIGFEAWLGTLAPLRLLVGFTYVLFVPGYCLTAALFPRSDDLDIIERIGLSLGLSIAWVPILALFLDGLPWGLGLWSITIGEGVSIAVFALVALWRRSRLPSDDTYTTDLALYPRSWWRSLPASDKWIQGIIIGALAVAGISLTWVFLTPSTSEVTTEFYMLGNNGLAEGFPHDAMVGQDLMVTIGTTNREQSQESYRVEVWVENPWTIIRRRRVAEMGPFVLESEENQELPITWSMPWSGLDQKVEFLLFVDDGAVPYRQLHLFLDVREQSGSLVDQRVVAGGTLGSVWTVDGAWLTRS